MAPVVKEVSHFKSTVVMSTSMNDMGTCGGLESGFPEKLSVFKLQNVVGKNPCVCNTLAVEHTTSPFR